MTELIVVVIMFTSLQEVYSVRIVPNECNYELCCKFSGMEVNYLPQYSKFSGGKRTSRAVKEKQEEETNTRETMKREYEKRER